MTLNLNPNTLATLAPYVSENDAGLTREQFLRMVAERINSDLAAIPVTVIATARERILAYLNGSTMEKSTSAVARACYLSTSTTRRILWELADVGIVNAMDRGASGAAGNPIYWEINQEAKESKS